MTVSVEITQEKPTQPRRFPSGVPLTGKSLLLQGSRTVSRVAVFFLSFFGWRLKELKQPCRGQALIRPKGTTTGAAAVIHNSFESCEQS